MRVGWRLGAALLLCAALAPPSRADDKKKPGLFSGWTPTGRQRERAQLLAPAALDLTPAPGARRGGPRTARLRFYADRDYRQTVLRWQGKLRGEIDRLNRVVGPVFGVTFEIESMREWPASHLGAPIDPVLAELEAMDAGRDVDWVIGLVTPFQGVTASIHQLGAAPYLSRHFVLRGMDDEQEGLMLRREFELLPEDERSALYSDRKAHKEAVVFLHEWAHTMGGLHNEDPAGIMNPLYDRERTGFSEFEKRLIALVVDRRLAHPGDLHPESQDQDLVSLLATAPTEEGFDRDRTALMELARERAQRRPGTAAPAVPTPPTATTTPPAPLPAAPTGPSPAVEVLPAADSHAYDDAVDALNAGRRERAWALLQPVVERHPRNASAGTLACHLVVGHVHAEDARVACDKAAAAAPQDARPLLEAAAAYQRTGNDARATPLLLAAANRIAAAPPDAKLAMRVGELAGNLGAVSIGEAALARAGQDSPELASRLGGLARALSAARRRLALPRDARRWGVPPEKEPAFAAAFWETATRIARSDAAAARARLHAFSTAYPDAPATDLLACEAEVRAHHAAAAEPRCEAALAKWDEVTRAHTLLAEIAAQSGRTAAAEGHFRRAIELDPSDKDAWRELAQLYRATHAAQSLADLRTRHQALLSSPLPE
jgi:predicted Zn-dependent protease